MTLLWYNFTEFDEMEVIYLSKRKENSRRTFAAILIFLMLSSPVTAFAESKSPTSSESAAVSSQVYEGKAGRAISESLSYDGRVYLSLSGIGNKSLYRYERFDVNIVGTRLNVQGFRFGETDYIPFREAARAIGASYEEDGTNGHCKRRLLCYICK